MGGREPRLGIGMRVGVREIRLDVEYGRVIDKVNASDMEKRTGRGGIIHIDETDRRQANGVGSVRRTSGKDPYPLITTEAWRSDRRSRGDRAVERERE